MKKIIVNSKNAGKKLNTFILDSFPDINKNILYKALRQKDIKINGKRVNDKDIILNLNDEISIYIDDKYLYKFSNFDFDIIYEDENILIINKPEGISVTEEKESNICLTKLLKEKINKSLEPCHRIDRNTKGLVLYAKNKEALSILLDKFKSKEIEKKYLAKVYGKMEKNHEILEAYLFKDSKKNLVYISNNFKKDYVKIITEYNVLFYNKNENTSILEVILHTGKTHQIRAHLSYIGHPIIGDGKYGINEVNKKLNKKTQELYSYSLKFNFKNDKTSLDYLNNKEIKININLN